MVVRMIAQSTSFARLFAPELAAANGLNLERLNLYFLLTSLPRNPPNRAKHPSPKRETEPARSSALPCDATSSLLPGLFKDLVN